MATNRAGPAATPALVRPWYRWLGRSAASPSVTMVKNKPNESTWAEFWNVFNIPAPAPLWSGGRLFITDAWLGEKNKPIPTANRKMSRANQM